MEPTLDHSLLPSTLRIRDKFEDAPVIVVSLANLESTLDVEEFDLFAIEDSGASLPTLAMNTLDGPPQIDTIDLFKLQNPLTTIHQH